MTKPGESTAVTPRPEPIPPGVASPARSRTLWSVLIFAVYAVITLTMIPFHEPWRDEAQSWLIARDLGPGGIVHQMGYEGTPALWHFLQAPLAKSGLPFRSLGVLNAAIAIAAVGLFCFASPFHPWQKAAAALSSVLLYEYGVIARCYAPIVFCLFLVAALYPARRTRPVAYGLAVCALANLNVLSLGVALLLAALLCLEACAPRKPGERPWLAACVGAVGVVLAILQLLPPPDLPNPGVFYTLRLGAVVAAPYGALLHQTFVPADIGQILSFVLLLVILWALRGNAVSLALAALVYLGWTYVFVFKMWYPPEIRHTGLYAFVLVFVFWIARADAALPPGSRRFRWAPPPGKWPPLRLAETITFACLALSCTHAARRCVDDVKRPFSASREAAAFIGRQDPATSWACFHTPSAVGVLPWLPDRRFFSLELQRDVTFATYSLEILRQKDMTDEEIVRRANGPGEKRRWLVLTLKLRRPEKWGYTLAWTNPEPALVDGEDFYIYKPR